MHPEAARHLVPGGSSRWAQIAPANAASVRAFPAAGFSPVGAEAHLACLGARPARDPSQRYPVTTRSPLVGQEDTPRPGTATASRISTDGERRLIDELMNLRIGISLN